MSNFKLIKTAAALALGASVVTSAVVPTDASAASKYKIKNGKLVIAKTGKVAKGYVTYKSTVYKNGKKLTGLKGKTYYKAGKKATGTYKGAYYYKGAKKVTTGTYKGAYYVKGVKKVTTGLYNGRYYKSGAKATGTYKGAYYVKGTKKVTTGTYNGAYYVKGFKKVTTGLYKEEFYQDGKLSKGYAVYNSILYKDAVHNVGLTVFEGKLYDGVSVNKGTEVFEGKLYKGAVLATGLVEHAGLFYNEGALANGVINNVEYKDGVVVKYEVTEVKTINASEFKVTFSKPMSGTALDSDFYEVEINGSKTNVGIQDIQFTDETKTAVIVRLDNKKTVNSFTEGDRIVIQVSDDVKTTEGKKIERFASKVFAFAETDKPQLKSSSINSKTLTLVFDRPVSSTSLIKVDGKEITSKQLVAQTHINLKGKTSEIAGNYVYTVVVDEALAADFNKVGNHEVILFNTGDTARTNSAVAPTLTSTYTVSDKDGIPEVVSLTARNANSFFITFSEEVKIASTPKSLVVKQGNVEYDVKFVNDISEVKTDTEVKAYAVPSNKKINSYEVVIPEEQNEQKFTNPLYINKANTATLDVTVNSFTDTTNQVGNASTKQVKLSKNANTPTIINLDTKDGVENNKIKSMKVIFDNPTVVISDHTAFTVKNAEGVVLKADQYSYANNTISITDSKDYSTKFTVTLAKEKTAYTVNTTKALLYNAEATKNNETSAIAEIKDLGNTKYHVAKLAATAVDNLKPTRTITLSSDVELGESAIDTANYKLDNKALPTGTKIEFLGDKKTLLVTLPEQSIKYSTAYNLEVSTNVKTKAGQSIVKDLKTLDAATLNVDLFDSVSPNLVGANYLVSSSTAKSTNFIEVTFDEDLAVITEKSKFIENLDVKVGGSGTSAKIEDVTIVKDENGKDRKVQIKLAAAVSTGQSTTVTLVKGDTSKVMSIIDTSALKNQATVGSNASATTSVVDGSGNVSKEEEKAAAVAELAKAKTDAKATLAAHKSAADYTVNKAGFDKAISDGNTAIDAATTKAAVTTALDAAKVAVEAVENDAAVAAALAKAKTDFTASITAANTAHDAAKEGNAIGEYTSGSKATLKVAIGEADKVLAEAKSTTKQLTDAKATLDAAIATFEAAKKTA